MKEKNSSRQRYFLSGKGEKGMLSTRKWNLIFKISCGILAGVLVSFVVVGSNILDLLYLGIIVVLFFKYVANKK